MEAVVLALIVAGGALLSTLLTTWLSGRQIRQGKAQDYARQDQVAAQAAEAARLLEERQNAAEAKAAGVATRLLAANERVAKQTADAAEVTNGKLDAVHELVNSNLDLAKAEAHTALIQQLVLMREVIALHTVAGRKPSQQALDAITVIERKVAELGTQLADRAKATEIAGAKLTAPTATRWPATES